MNNKMLITISMTLVLIASVTTAKEIGNWQDNDLKMEI